MKDFVQDLRFDKLGVFTYSREEGTAADTFPEQLEEEVKLARKEELMLLQQDISLQKLQGMVGKTLKVLIEGKLPDEDVYVGRTYMDMPGVDGYMFVHSTDSYMSGDFVDVVVRSASEYDLIGEPA